MTTITSLQNPRVKNAVRLRHRRHRRQQDHILIDGARELGRAIGAGVELAEVFVCEPLCTSAEAKDVAARLGDCTTEVLEVGRAVFEKLAFGQRSEGVLGVAVTPSARLEDIQLAGTPLVAVLEGVEKPGNVGAVLRSADSAGVDAVVLADPRTDLFNPNAIRASLGTIFTVPVATATAEETIHWIGRQGLAAFSARVDGSVPYTDADYRQPAAIILGSETAGLTDAWSGDWITPVRLPMLGAADSLNVSITAAVLFYEALRQRGDRSLTMQPPTVL